VTNAGGPAVLAADSVIDHRGHLAKLSEKSLQLLNDNLPLYWSHGNPVDLLGDADVTIRPIRPEDESIESEFIRALSPETSRFRFFQVIKDLTHEALVRFCNIDYDREMAFIAETHEGERRVEIGVARLILEPGNTRGEMAVVIADRYQQEGLGKKLVDMLIDFAKEKGVESIYGIIVPENLRMIRFCEKLGFSIQRKEDNVLAELNLK
jgi:acetyltransferase